MGDASTTQPRYVAFGQRLRAARQRRGLSHDTLAERCGLNLPGGRIHLISLEKGKHMPKPALLSALARETGTTVQDLVGEADDEEAAQVVSLDLYQALRTLCEPIIKAEVRAVLKVKA